MGRCPAPPSARSASPSTAACETLHADAGAQVLVLTSCSAELGIELRSAYLGGEGREELLVAESAVLGAGPAEFCTRRLEAPAAIPTPTSAAASSTTTCSASRTSPAPRGWALAFEGVDAAAAQLDPLLAL